MYIQYAILTFYASFCYIKCILYLYVYAADSVMIGGTSTCHMLLSDQEVFVDGVWGPYYGAMVPKLWLLEGGQSATGKLIDHVISTHPAAKDLNVMDGM